MPLRSSRFNSQSSPANHAFVAGVGYVDFGKPPLSNPGNAATNLCSPPDSAADGTRHILQAPNGGPKLPFVWHKDSKSWARLMGMRLAFTDAYLSQAGWTYVGPAKKHDGHACLFGAKA